MTQTPKKYEYRIVQYPDSDSPSGKVYFIDKREVKRFLKIFKYRTNWVTVKWSDGESMYFYKFNKATDAANSLKKGVKMYKQ